MLSITFDEFKSKEKIGVNQYSYIDLHLDLVQETSPVNAITSFNKKDLLMSYDEEAIKNSIINILNTIPGERILYPTFGCNLLAYVFRPVSQTTAKQIGDTILYAIKQWEPRVTVVNVLVVGKPDEHTYEVTLVISIPVLRKSYVKLVGVLSKEGFLEQLL